MRRASGLNAVIPGRGGDAVKVAIIRARVPGSSVPTITATLSVVVLFDLVAASALVLLVGTSGALPLAPRLPSAGAAAAWAASHALVVAGASALIAAAATVAVRRLRAGLRRLLVNVRQGGAILRTPRRYVTTVAAVQSAAWACRVGVVFFLLAAFGLPASIPLSALVMILCGASTIVPLTPGGAGTQQAMLALALKGTATVAASLSFSVGMQVGITVVNSVLGIAAAMLLFRTLRPASAIRAGLRPARSDTPAA
jgi:glycosyltransferase 2 family protein